MKNTRQTKAMAILAATFFCHAANSQELLLQILPIEPFCLLCSFTNSSPNPYDTPGYFLCDDNNLFARELSNNEPLGFGIGPYIDWLEMPQPIAIPPNQCRVETIFQKTIRSYLGRHRDAYLACTWECGTNCSLPIVMGFSREGAAISPPAFRSNWSTLSVHMAFVFNELEPNDLAFIYLNGGNETNCLSSPLSSESSLVVTSPSIGYSNEVTSAAYASTNALVAPRMAEHWRIPWPDVWGRIPVEDRERLRKSGKIDLRWKCGDIVSDPLPLWVGSLDDMTNNPYATGEM